VASILGICNAALTKLGQEPITDITDNNKRAKLLNANYLRVKQKLLRRHPWSFAKKRVNLLAQVTTPLYEFSHEYLLPVDFIRLDKLQFNTYEHAIEGNKLLYNGGDEINLVYICDADEADFDSLFEDLLAHTLADEICLSLTQNQQLKSDLRAELEYLINETRSTNAQVRGTPQEIETDDFLLARL
jgi:hypothetical protein